MADAQVLTQLLDQIVLGIQRHQRHPQAIGQTLPAGAARLALLAVALTQIRILGIQFKPRIAFAEAQQAGRGQGVIQWIEQRQQQQVDMAREQAELLLGGIPRAG